MYSSNKSEVKNIRLWLEGEGGKGVQWRGGGEVQGVFGMGEGGCSVSGLREASATLVSEQGLALHPLNSWVLKKSLSRSDFGHKYHSNNPFQKDFPYIAKADWW